MDGKSLSDSNEQYTELNQIKSLNYLSHLQYKNGVEVESTKVLNLCLSFMRKSRALPQLSENQSESLLGSGDLTACLVSCDFPAVFLDTSCLCFYGIHIDQTLGQL